MYITTSRNKALRYFFNFNVERSLIIIYSAGTHIRIKACIHFSRELYTVLNDQRAPIRNGLATVLEKVELSFSSNCKQCPLSLSG